jgi:hypothetical protein
LERAQSTKFTSHESLTSLSLLHACNLTSYSSLSAGLGSHIAALAIFPPIVACISLPREAHAGLVECAEKMTGKPDTRLLLARCVCTMICLEVRFNTPGGGDSTVARRPRTKIADTAVRKPGQQLTSTHGGISSTPNCPGLRDLRVCL